jgi:predicted AAA+ superfamily ATPase
MDTQLLHQIITDQKEAFNRPRNLIEREVDLKPYLKTKQVVVITGIRRCGKSSLLYLIKEKLGLKENQFCYFNFDDERIIHESELLDQIYLAHIEEYKQDPVFFFDEIQNVPKWEKFVNRMHEKGLRLFVTGSNANLLSSEIATSLTGRNKTITLYPFSFSEYLKITGKNYVTDTPSSKQVSLIQSDLTDYMRLGGMPLVIAEDDLDLINQYFQDILYRDIVARYRIQQVNELKQIALYLFANTSKLFSYATLQSVSGVKSTYSVKSYVEYLEQSYLFSYLKKFDYSVKKQLMNSRKAFVVDTAFANHLGFQFSENKGRLLENCVYLQLLRQGKQVFYHSAKKECDFLIQKGLKITEAIQVCYELNDLNIQREVDGLNEAMQIHSLKKGTLIIGRNQLKKSVLPQHMHAVPAWQWLLQ